jgi:hypothetical protein
VLKVESTMSGSPASCAMALIFSRSQISSAGLDTDSQNTARVLSLIAPRNKAFQMSFVQLSERERQNRRFRVYQEAPGFRPGPREM